MGIRTGRLFGIDGYEAAVREMVEEFAPRRFAVFQDLGNRVDGRVAAWGMAFEDHVDIIDADGSCWTSMSTPEAALRGYARPPEVDARVIWVDTA
ncbi:MAG TPA: hypothetical protein VEO01_23120 [Pseudonocardiaceae bacterium]|nr:hypothetical protein [Pseudonocardiaceae bacterium]